MIGRGAATLHVALAALAGSGCGDWLGTFLIEGAPCEDNRGCPAPLVCRDGACSDPIARVGRGWIAFVSADTGADELWLSLDDGAHQVRITEGFSTSAGAMKRPTFSWDGKYVAVISNRQPGGELGDPHLWRVKADGDDARPVAAVGVTAGGLSWEGDSRHLMFTATADPLECSDDIVRIDAIEVANPETVIGRSRNEIASDPAVRPTDANEVLFNEQACTEQGHLALWRRDTGESEPVPDADGVRAGTWRRDGSAVLIGGTGSITEHDLAVARVLYSEEGTQFLSPVEDDASRLYVSSLDGTQRRVLRVEDGAAEEVSIPQPLASTSISWARLDEDPDRDNDGLGNGIDDTPDGG